MRWVGHLPTHLQTFGLALGKGARFYERGAERGGGESGNQEIHMYKDHFISRR